MEHQSYDIDYDRLKRTVELAVRFLDDVIDVNNYPLPEIDKITRATRKIGLGVMGFADMLIKMGIPYGSPESIHLAENIMGHIETVAHRYSTKLAEEKGTYPAQKENVLKLSAKRNNTLTTIAPTGTLSIIADVSSGIEPIFSMAYYRNAMNGTMLPYVNQSLEEFLHEYFTDESCDYLIDRIIQNHGSTKGLNRMVGFDFNKVNTKKDSISKITVLQYMELVFVSAHDITPENHIKMQAAFQHHTDNAISKTINFPNTATMDDVRTAYMLAYDLGCKGTTVYRDGCRDTQVLTTMGSKTPETTPETEKNFEYPDSFHELPADIKKKYLHEIVNNTAIGDVACNGCTKTTDKVIPRQRPEEVVGSTKKFQIGCGKLYVTVNHDENGICEVFTSNGKSGGCPSQSEAAARLVSIALRAGVDVKDVVKQLRGIRCPSCQRNPNVKVLSCPDAIGRMLEESADKLSKQKMSIDENTPKLDMRINNNKVEVAGIDYPVETGDVKRSNYEDTILSLYSKDVIENYAGLDEPTQESKITVDCPECGSLLEHEGGCVICRECGWSKCN